LLAPGFIDVQVNGGAGTLFNADPSTAAVARLAESHRRFGTTGLLPTVITDRPEILARAIAAVRNARAAGFPRRVGVPPRGPRPPRHIGQMGEADIAALESADCGVLMLTLAPNRVAPAVISRLAQAGILVSLGHSAATGDEAQAALAAGARAFTHLFNAMSQMEPRKPGMVGAAL